MNTEYKSQIAESIQATSDAINNIKKPKFLLFLITLLGMGFIFYSKGDKIAEVILLSDKNNSKQLNKIADSILQSDKNNSKELKEQTKILKKILNRLEEKGKK